MHTSVTDAPSLTWPLSLHLHSILNPDPIYFWQQTSEDITVTVRLPQGATKGDVRFALTPDNISVGVQGFAPLLEGQLHESVDPEASAWIMKDDKRFA